VPLQRPTLLEATALGAVSLAGLGVGLWPDTQTLAATWKCDRAFSPAGDPEHQQALRKAWREAIACA
jgi:glycerol kinase